ncbi:MAG: hypothetical protein Q7R73_03235 [bacterium]|nr:hypothetical protein [bacterium]
MFSKDGPQNAIDAGIFWGLKDLFQTRNYEAEEAICYLSLFLEYGTDIFKKMATEQYHPAPEKLLHDEIAKILRSLPQQDPETIAREKRIATALRLTMFRRITEDAKKWQALFLTRLYEIFPRPDAEKICTIALEHLDNDLRLGGKEKAMFTQEALSEYRAWRKQILNIERKANRAPFAAPQQLHTGTDTKLVPCPECGFKKRVGKDTKRFKCKNPKPCSFDQPYPFPATP